VRFRRPVHPVVIVLAVAGLLTGFAGPASSGSALARATGPAAAERSVTLITGDRVLVRPGSPPRIRLVPGPGRRAIQFLQYTSRGHAYVLPSDAAPLVAAGRVDRRLFDVVGLLAQGYGDEARRDLPLLARYVNAAALGARSAAPPGSTVARRFRHQPVAALTARKDQPGAFWNSTVDTRTRTLRAGVDRIWLDGKAALSLAESVPHVGAPQAWQRGLTGEGVPVAVLDTGLDTTHPDFAGAVAATANFTNDPAGVTDTIGHGTHVASILAGRGTASGGRYTGVARGARLLVGKVCADTESSDAGPCPESAILAGMEWAAAAGARVVNLSLGTIEPSDGTDPLSVAVNALTDQYGTLFVASSGNHAPWLPGEGTVVGPAAADAALAVGNLTKDDRLSDSSNQGPRVGDFALKPDLAAPGEDIIAARAAQGYLGEPVDEHHARLSGTSMASPHVAGGAAILAQQHPTWRAAELKAALLSAAAPVEDLSVYARGAGLLDLDRATGQPVWASPGSVSLAYFRWPHGSAPPTRATVTYHNDADAAVDLALELTMTDAAGNAPPAGMFGLDATAVTVPAHGTATVTVTTTAIAGTAGLYGGALLARGGATVVRTALGAYQETESYDLSVSTLDRTGARPGALQPTILVADLDSGAVREVRVAGGVATARLPKGRYAVWSGIATDATPTDKQSLTLAFAPEIALTRDVAVAFDARAARPVREVVDRPGAVSNGTETFGVFQTAGGATQYVTGSVFDVARLFVLGTSGSAPGFGFFHAATLLEPEIQLDALVPDRFAVPVSYIDVTYTPHFIGETTLAVVDGGKGTPEELRRARGRLVLLTLNGPGEMDAVAERAANVAAAGGRAVLLTTPHPPTNLEAPLALPTMSTDSGPGARLLRAVRDGNTRIRLRGLPGSPYQYNLMLVRTGAIPARPTFRVRDHELAAVRTSYATQAVDAAIATTYTSPPLSGWISPVQFALPMTRTEYFSTGTLPGTTDPIAWFMELRNESSWDASRPWGGWQNLVRGPYRPGRSTERYNRGPFVPCLGSLPEPEPLFWFTDVTDLLVVRLPQHCTGEPPIPGSAVTFFGEDSGSTIVRRDGVELGRSEEPGDAFIETTAGPGRYEVAVTATRNAPWTTLNARQSATWAFDWSDVERVPPLLAVRLGADLDERNRAPRGRHPLRVWVDRTATAGPVTALTLQISYDDGRTWSALPARRDGERWTAQVHPPASASYVSVRATAADASGSSVASEVIRAYALR
jgi:subtilisin family serine protease